LFLENISGAGFRGLNIFRGTDRRRLSGSTWQLMSNGFNKITEKKMKPLDESILKALHDELPKIEGVTWRLDASRYAHFHGYRVAVTAIFDI